MVIPIYAGLDRLPDSLLEASTDLGAKAGRTFRARRAAACWCPSIVAGSMFTFSLSLGDLHEQHRRRHDAVHRQHRSTSKFGANLPFAAAYAWCRC